MRRKFVKKHKRMLTLVSALVAFVLYFVREVVDDHIQKVTNAIELAENSYTAELIARRSLQIEDENGLKLAFVLSKVTGERVDHDTITYRVGLKELTHDLTRSGVAWFKIVDLSSHLPSEARGDSDFEALESERRKIYYEIRDFAPNPDPNPDPPSKTSQERLAKVRQEVNDLITRQDRLISEFLRRAHKYKERNERVHVAALWMLGLLFIIGWLITFVKDMAEGKPSHSE